MELKYCPKTTLLRKFGNLPVKYFRTKISNGENFKILEEVAKRYRFDLADGEVDDEINQSKKRKLNNPQEEELPSAE